MLEQDYNWTRFWCPTTDKDRLSDFGYLSDPESEYGRLIYPDVVSLESIAHIPCLILLGEPGIGKSSELEKEKKRIQSQQETLYIDLHDYGNETSLINDLFTDNTFTKWQQRQHDLFIFLDSLDEGLLQINKLSSCLKRELKKRCSNHFNRLYLRITCRIAYFQKSLEEEFKKFWGNESVNVYQLLPLSHNSIIEAANKNHINFDEFWQAINQANAIPLAMKPNTLKLLLTVYTKNESLPEQASELYKIGCERLCQENNSNRQEAKQTGKLSEKERMMTAGRMAAICIICNRAAIWVGENDDDKPEEDLSIRELYPSKETVNVQEFTVHKDEILETINTELFDSRGTKRMRFAHQTYAEFLAAWYLVQKGISLTQLKGLITAQDDSEGRLIPQLHETVSWLCSLNEEVLQEVMKTDPDVLLQSDIPKDDTVKAAIATSFLSLYQENKLRNDFSRRQGYIKLKHPNLAEQLRHYINDSSKNIDVRSVAIDIAQICQLRELQDDLAEIALDSQESINVRVGAARYIQDIGDKHTRLKLKPLACEPIAEDEYDELKGYSLAALWDGDDCITTEELFQALTKPKVRNFTGQYRVFIYSKIVSKLKLDDLPIALDWLKKQGVRFELDQLAELGDSILLKAWEYLLQVPNFLENFVNVALIQWQEYQHLIVNNSAINFNYLLLNDEQKRKAIITEIVKQLANNSQQLKSFYPYDNIYFKQDFLWIIEKFKSSEAENIKKIFADLAWRTFNHQEILCLDADTILTLAPLKENEILYQKFAKYLDRIELESEITENLREEYRRQQENLKPTNHSTLTQSPQERINICLHQIESGDFPWWWNLTRDMTLQCNSRFYNNLWEIDLTILPGWKNGDLNARKRIVEAAKTYLQNTELVYPKFYENLLKTNLLFADGLKCWKFILYLLIFINKINDSFRHDLTQSYIYESDYLITKALELILKEEPEFIDNLPDSAWKQYTPFILIGGAKSQKLFQLAYQKAHQEFLDSLSLIIEREIQAYNNISIIEKIEFLWNSQIEEIVLCKLKYKSCNLEVIKQLLTILFKQQSKEAKQFAQSLVTIPLPTTEIERKKAIVAASVLIDNSDDNNWPIVWQAIQNDTEFGKQILSNFSYRISNIKLNISEENLANFYIWLVHQYPYSEDPIIPEAHAITSREQIAGIRDNILSQLRDYGTYKACQEIERIMREFPELDWLKYTLIEAKNNARRKKWTSPTPSQLLQILTNKDKYFIEDGNQLLEVLIESLQRLEEKLQGETPAAKFLWDEQFQKPNQNNSDEVKKKAKKKQVRRFRPKSENDFSDYVKCHFDEDLKKREIIVNREVELRAGTGGNPGERTDIHVDAILKDSNGQMLNKITVIIEAKGCWNNKELNEAIKTQLVKRYLEDNAQCKHGLYLVGWFNCLQWDDSDSRKKSAPKISIEEAREKFEKQADELSSSNVTVKAFVLNASLR